MTILIVANGDVMSLDWVKAVVDRASLVIAADGGANHLHQIGRKPQLVVGDLDSVSAETRAWLKGVEQLRFSAEKDQTDLELAIQYAVRHSAEPIRIVGAFGGRIDHQLANILLLTHPAWRSRDIRLIAPYQENCHW